MKSSLFAATFARCHVMPQRTILISMVVIGVAFVILGTSWKWLHPPESYWSEKQAQQYLDAFTAVHAAEDSHGTGSAGDTDFVAARQRYDIIKNELDQARSARDRTSNYLTIAGLALFLSVLLLWHFYAPPTDEMGG